MIDIPIGKALVPVESENSCVGCILEGIDISCVDHGAVCQEINRKDGKSVIFKLVDYPGEQE